VTWRSAASLCKSIVCYLTSLTSNVLRSFSTSYTNKIALSNEPTVVESKDVDTMCMICNENIADLLLVPCCHVVCQKCNNKLQPIGKSKFSLGSDPEQHCYFCKKPVLTTKVIAKKVNPVNTSTGSFGAWNNIGGSNADPLSNLLSSTSSFGNQEQGWSPLNRITNNTTSIGGFSDSLPPLNANTSVFSNSSNTNTAGLANTSSSNNGNVNYNLWNSAPFENLSLFGSGSSSLFPGK